MLLSGVFSNYCCCHCPCWYWCSCQCVNINGRNRKIRIVSSSFKVDSAVNGWGVPHKVKVLLPLLRGLRYVRGKQCCCVILSFSDTEKHHPKFPMLYIIWNIIKNNICSLPNLLGYVVCNAKQFCLRSLKWKDDLWKKTWQFFMRIFNLV